MEHSSVIFLRSLDFSEGGVCLVLPMEAIQDVCLLKCAIRAVTTRGIGYERESSVVLLSLKKQKQFRLKRILISRVQTKDWNASHMSMASEWK